MGGHRERMERPVRTGMEYRARLSTQERARLERWESKATARVIHPVHGTVVVPHHSNLAAVMNAAEVWGCDWTELRDAAVLRSELGDIPAHMPHLI